MDFSGTAPAPTEAVGVPSYILHTVKSSLHLVSRNVDKYVVGKDVLPSYVSDPDCHGTYRVARSLQSTRPKHGQALCLPTTTVVV